MRELSLFSGAGGGLLGTKLLGWMHVGYVEWDDYCQRVIAQRIADGYLDRAPIFGDVREFAQSGAAEQYRGIADVLTAGFPCQPFSVAGKQAGADDERNMWPATRDVIRIVRPRSVLLENVPGLIVCGYLGTVIGDLAALGYVGRYGVIGAHHAGAPHKRDRLWIVGHADSGDDNSQRGVSERSSANTSGIRTVAHATGLFGNEREHHAGSNIQNNTAHPVRFCELGNRGDGPDVADAEPSRLERFWANAGQSKLAELGDDGSAGDWWRTDPADDPESGVGRVAHGIPNRVEQLKALGNAQVPSVVALAWRLLA